MIRSRVAIVLACVATFGVEPRGVRSLEPGGFSPRDQQPSLPTGPLVFAGFKGEFRGDGTFTIAGPGWPELIGTFTTANGQLTLALTREVRGCAEPGVYGYERAGTRLTLTVVTDTCTPRRMILGGSTWRPANEPEEIPKRAITTTTATPLPPLPAPVRATASARWPSFRGERAAGVADGQQLPETWNVTTGENILWKTAIPGLAHSSPIVWGDLVFVTSAVSERQGATFKPGLYGDGDASDDRSPHRWMLYAVHARTGAIAWERVAHHGVPRNKRHIKSTYASASPATDGRVVVAWFGSEGVFAYDMRGNLRWKVDLGRVDMGAYDIPTYEWGPASSPVIWNDLVIVQCDTQADSFLIALDVATGRTVWKTDRDELPSWGTPTVVETNGVPVVVTNASNYVRGYDARSGVELWKLGRSSKITAPTPIAADGLFIVASGRAPERPIFAVRPGAMGDLTPSGDATSSEGLAWSKTGRGSYMPTPLAYRGVLYVLANNGLFDAYRPETGAEVYRQRLPHAGSGFSGSPVAADGRIYIPNEDGDILVVSAGAEFAHIATNAMGEYLMATPAIAGGVLYVRSQSTLWAIARR